MRPNLSAILLITAVLAIEMSAASAEPDLVVPSGEISIKFPGPGNVVFRDESYVFTWKHNTKNVGDSAAQNTNTNVEIDGKRPTPGGLLAVPRLVPGASHAGNGQFGMDFVTWEFGTYPTRICADALHKATESDEQNNCLPLAPLHVVPTRFRGRISGSIESPPPAKGYESSWSADVVLELSRSITGNVATINYAFKQLSVLYKMGGPNDSLAPCTYSGTATDRPTPPQKITLRFGQFRSTYQARNFFSDGFTISTTIKCPGAPPLPVSYTPPQEWFRTGPINNLVRAFQNPGLEALRGRTVWIAPSGIKLTHSWNLEALD